MVLEESLKSEDNLSMCSRLLLPLDMNSDRKTNGHVRMMKSGCKLSGNLSKSVGQPRNPTLYKQLFPPHPLDFNRLYLVSNIK